MQAQVVETAVGLIAAFALVSVMASALVELGSTLFRKRSKDLLVALERLSSAKANNALDVTQTSVWQSLAVVGRRKRGPIVSHDRRTPSYMSAASFADAVVERLRALRTQGERAEDLLDALPDSPLTRRLQQLHLDVGGDLVELKAGVEHWFDDTMDRLQGSYKRWSQWFLFVAGLGLAACLNVSAVRIVDSLWNDQVTRSAVLAGIDATESQCPVDEPECSGADRLAGAIDDVDALGLPIGWGDGWADESGVIWTLLGILPTGLAATVGAPFWFDLLRRLSVGGSRGVPPRAGDDPRSASNERQRVGNERLDMFGSRLAPP